LSTRPRAKEKHDYKPSAHEYIREVVNERLKTTVQAQLLPAKDGATSLHILPSTLLSALWFQFASEVARNVERFLCPGCKEWKRKDFHKGKQYCSPKCRMRVQRAKMERARQLKSEGRSDEAIAKEVGSRVATVRKWGSSNK
jgi:hypothetical protein